MTGRLSAAAIWRGVVRGGGGVSNRVKIALYQPDIAANVGAILRLGACLDVAVEIIEPCGFPFDMRLIRRVALDYIDHVNLHRHSSWAAFQAAPERAGERLILLSTKGAVRYDEFAFRRGDTLLFGRESAGVPREVAAAGRRGVARAHGAGYAISQCRQRRRHDIG